MGISRDGERTWLSWPVWPLEGVKSDSTPTHFHVN